MTTLVSLGVRVIVQLVRSTNSKGKFGQAMSIIELVK